MTSQERLAYWREYHRERRARDPELYKERGRVAAATFRAKNIIKLKEQKLTQIQTKIDELKFQKE